jgi:23S rRNA U2552 (ribose-2'-O)-methylase RlmE/FtsJ
VVSYSQLKEITPQQGMLNNTYYTVPPVMELVICPVKGNRNILLNKLGYDPILNETKNKISNMRYSKWSRLRKASNDFEFPLDDKKLEKPISRAFFKLLEIIKDHNISIQGDTLHLAEAPGGFIECTRYVKNKMGRVGDKYYTFSILGGAEVPVYNRNLVRDSNIIILSNKENNGDLYSTQNIKNLVETLDKKNVMFITCDGGFNENSDFASKEQLHHHLIYNEILTSLLVLKNGGSMVIKIFDIFTELTYDFIYLLSYLFCEVCISKPNTSRPTNSEKYIVCKRFKHHLFDQNLQNVLKSMCVAGIENYSSFVHKGTMQKDVLDAVKNINTYFLKYQVYNINNIIQVENLDLKISRSQQNIDEWIDRYY